MAFEQLRSRLISILAGDNISIYDKAGSPYVPPWSNPPRRSVEQWLNTYGKSPRLSVVTKIAEDLAFIDGKLKRKGLDGEDEDLPETHPFWAFWDNPNPLPQFTKEAIWQLHEIFLKLAGEGFMIIEKDMWGYPAELWPIPPHWVTSTPTAGNPFYNVLTAAGFMAQVHVNDMFVQMDLNPADPYGRGLGQAQAIGDEVEIDEYAAIFEKRFFYNDATPNSVIALEGADADAVDRFEAKWNKKYRGVNNSHKTAIASGRVTAVKLADNMKDLDMIEGRKFLRDQAIEHFHVPREIMGITENSNRSTAEAAQYIYAQNVLTAEIRKRQRALNIQLIPYWGDDLKFEYDEIIPRNQEFDKALATEGYAGGYVMLNEARKKVDLEAVPNGDVFQSTVLFGYVTPDQDLTGTTVHQPTDYDDYKSLSGFGKKSRLSQTDQRAITMFERMQREQERHTENVVTQHFSGQRKELLEKLRASSKGKKDNGDVGGVDFEKLKTQLDGITDPVGRADIVLNFVEQLTDWRQDEQRMREILSNTWSQSYEQGKDIMQNLYNLKNPHRPDVVDVFSRMGGQKIARGISETTRNSVVDIINTGLQNDLDINDIASQIGDSTDLGRVRAKIIANQETYNSVSAANFDSMSENGIQRHKWVTRGDGDVRDSHAKVNGQVRKVGEKFSNGCRYPRDPEGKKEEVMGCRCWNLPVRERSKNFKRGVKKYESKRKS